MQPVEPVVKGLIGRQTRKPGAQIPAGKAMYSLDFKMLLFTDCVQINGQRLLISELRFTIIAITLTFIFQVFAVPFAYVKVEGY